MSARIRKMIAISVCAAVLIGCGMIPGYQGPGEPVPQPNGKGYPDVIDTAQQAVNFAYDHMGGGHIVPYGKKVAIFAKEMTVEEVNQALSEPGSPYEEPRPAGAKVWLVIFYSRFLVMPFSPDASGQIPTPHVTNFGCSWVVVGKDESPPYGTVGKACPTDIPLPSEEDMIESPTPTYPRPPYPGTEEATTIPEAPIIIRATAYYPPPDETLQAAPHAIETSAAETLAAYPAPKQTEIAINQILNSTLGSPATAQP